MVKNPVKYFKAWLFDWRLKRAIRKADRSARTYRRKYIVIVFDGRPVCVSSQGIKKLIKQHRFMRGVTYDTILQRAAYIAYPPKKNVTRNS